MRRYYVTNLVRRRLLVVCGALLLSGLLHLNVEDTFLWPRTQTGHGHERGRCVLSQLQRHRSRRTSLFASSVPQPPSEEDLMVALGRECWLVADYWLEAAFLLSECRPSPPGARGGESSAALAQAGTAMRNAAEMMMTNEWEEVMGEIENIAAHMEPYLEPERPDGIGKLDGIVNLFAYVEPVPACEWNAASTSLVDLSESLTAAAGRLRRGNNAPPVSLRGADNLIQSSEVLSRMVRLFKPSTFYMPKDPRDEYSPPANSYQPPLQAADFESSYGSQSPPRGSNPSGSFGSSFRDVNERVAGFSKPEDPFELERRAAFEEALSDISEQKGPQAAMSGVLQKADADVRSAAALEEENDKRRSSLQKLVRSLHPDSNPGREDEVLPAFRYVQRLRQSIPKRK